MAWADQQPNIRMVPHLDHYGSWPATGESAAQEAVDARHNLMFGRLAVNSVENYGVGWKHWSQYAFLRGCLPTPLSGPGGTAAFEALVLDFVVSEQVDQKLAPATISNRLYAVRYALITLGYGDMLEWGPRLKLAAKALKKAKAKKVKKLPVTRAMLEWLARNLRLGQDGSEPQPEEVRLWVLVVLAYFFLLRVGEGLELRFGSVQPMRNGAYCQDWGVADGVALLISG